MMRFLLGITLASLVFVVRMPAMAQVDIDVNISLPPPLEFMAPPNVVVIPETYVYVDPDIAADLFFWNGFWWRLWEGRWYRSHNYDRDWSYYKQIPLFYRSIPPGWRNNYRDHRWGGKSWEYKRIPHQQLIQNWSRWGKDRHWEREGTWYVKGLKPRDQKKGQRNKYQQPRKEKKNGQMQRQKEHQENINQQQRQKERGQMRGQKEKSREDSSNKGEHGDRGERGERGDHGR